MENLQGIELIKHRIKNPENQHELLRSYKKKLRQGVHADAISSLDEKTKGHTDLFEWIRDKVLNNTESFDSISGIMVPPFPTNELNQSIYSDCSRIFNAQDYFQKITWSDKNRDKEAKTLLEKSGECEFWETQGIEQYRIDPDCFVIVDKPVKGSPDMTPYFYTLGTEYVYSVSLKKKAGIITVEYIIFKQGEEFVYFDDMQAAILDKDENIKTVVDHKIGYTPVAPFWQTTFNSKTKIQKKNRDAVSLGDYDWLFFYEYAKKWQDLNNPFPMWAMYDFRCTYIDKQTGQSCEKGYINYTYEGKPAQKACPSCSNKFRRGPDRIVRVPAPQDNDSPDLMAHLPVQTISPEVAAMEFVREEVDRLKASIYKNSAGVDLEGIKKQAINQDQVESYFEGKRSILKFEKRNFDIIRAWLIKTLLRYEFGDSVQEVYVDHGEEWYLDSEMEEVEEYKVAKESGLPIYDLKSRREALIHSRFKNNPEKTDRALIMAALEPSPDSSLSELISLKMQLPELITDDEIILKKNFSNFIDRFERENGPLQDFGINLVKDEVTDDGNPTQKVRIEQIKSILQKYVTESRGRSGQGDPEKEREET